LSANRTRFSLNTCKHAVFLCVAQCLRPVGLLSFLLAITNYWGVKQCTGRDRKAIFPYIKKLKERHLLILVGHRVNDSDDPFLKGMSPRLFREQLELLKEYYQILDLSDAVRRLQKNDLPPNALAITFDDGYRDNYEFAFPILKDLNLPATIFLSTGPLDSKHDALWHDLVFDAFRQGKFEKIVIGKNVHSLRTVEEKQVALFAFRQYLRDFDFRNWPEIILKLRIDLGLGGETSCPGFEKLTWNQVREMADNGITIGAHTVHHPILTCLPITQAAREIEESSVAIERQLGRRVEMFAYPNGNRKDFDNRVKRLVLDQGFLGAVSTIQSTNTRLTDRFELRRIPFFDDKASIAALRLGWQKSYHAKNEETSL
jgi:peptidoglycan/xylan/chitin deacetylase (PgdA/CDA1 family)